MWAAGAGTPGSPPSHLLQSQSQSRSQTDVHAEGAVPSGLAAVPAAHAGMQQMMTGGLSTVGLAPGVEDPALGVEDLTPGAQTPANLAPGAVL